MMQLYDPANWNWIVAGDTSQAWSSAAMAYVSTWDPGRSTRIASEGELWDVLIAAGVLKTRLFKTTLWRRCTNAEFVAIRAVIASQDERTQAIWADANYIDSRDETYSQIQGAATALFGAARAAELLAPTE